jgi:hypothetical protein
METDKKKSISKTTIERCGQRDEVAGKKLFSSKSQLPTLYKNNALTCLNLKLRARLQRLIVLRTIKLTRSFRLALLYLLEV